MLMEKNDDEEVRPVYKVRSRRQVRERMVDIKAYIDERRGNDPEDEAGWRVLLTVINDINRVRFFPYIGKQVATLSVEYRQQLLGKTYLLYYRVDEDKQTIYLIDLRHMSQRPLKPGTVRKYSRQISAEE